METSQVEKIRLPVRGMHCASCSARIEKVIGDLEGVESCQVNLATEMVHLVFDSAAISLAEIAGHIGDLGFELVLQSPENKEVTLDIQGMSCASCSSRIEKVVGDMAGVEQCSVNLATQKAIVVYDPQRLHVRDLLATIKEIGFTAQISQGGGRNAFARKQQENEEKLRTMLSRLWPSLFWPCLS